MKIKERSGITLIALVITIIVLLILAGVTIAMLLGPNGLITKSETALERSKEEEEKEKLALVMHELQIDKKTNKDYNENEYITTKIKEKGMEFEDEKKDEIIVIVDEYKFKIDRNVPTIVENLGKPQTQLYLIKDGKENTDVTGGHIIRDLCITASIKDGNNCIIFDSPKNYASGYVIKDSISEDIVSRYSKVFCEYEIVAKYDEWRIVYICQLGVYSYGSL